MNLKGVHKLRRILLINQLEENIDEFKALAHKFMLMFTFSDNSNKSILKTTCVEDSLLVQLVNHAEQLKALGFNPTDLVAYCVYFGEDPLSLYTFDSLDDEYGFYPLEHIIKNKEYIFLDTIIGYMASKYDVDSAGLKSLFHVLDSTVEDKSELCKMIKYSLTEQSASAALPHLD